MAATGLLGINPYYKGAAIDVSKPVNLAIQLEQKERAKQEALDKYFMDYEKSLNSAGMRQQDQDVFLRKLADNKSYYLKNREKILNPSKYGAEAQSQYMSNYKDILSDINKSKQLAANGKVLSSAIIDARKNNRTIPKEVADAIFNNELSMGDAGFQAFDPVNFDAYDKNDATKYANSIYSKIKLSESKPQRFYDPEFNEVSYKTVSDISNKSFGQIENLVASELQRNRGLVDDVKALARDENELNKLAKLYQDFSGKKLNPNSLQDVATAYTISLKPEAKVTYTTPRPVATGDSKEDNFSPELMVDQFYEAGDDYKVYIGGKVIEGKKIQLPPEVAINYDRKVGNKKFSPNYFVMSKDKLNVYPIFVTGQTKSGNDILSGEGGTNIDEKIPVKTSLIPTIGKEYGGIGYTRKNLGKTQGGGKKTKTYKGLDENGNPIYE
jgi:hypothetical protein